MRKLSLYAQTPVRLAAAAAAQQVARVRRSVEVELAKLKRKHGSDALRVAGSAAAAAPGVPHALGAPDAEEAEAARYVSLVRRAISTDLRVLQADMAAHGWKFCRRDAADVAVEVCGIPFAGGEQRRT